jgi:hypothetical protein
MARQSVVCSGTPAATAAAFRPEITLTTGVTGSLRSIGATR